MIAAAHALALHYGVPVEITDLGAWGGVQLVAEYDPRGPVIRVNARLLPSALRPAAGDDGTDERWIARAVAHELYHHREALGEVARIANRRRREAAADAFADDLAAAR